MCLGPGQRHEITVAMSRASGPGRAAECGILQQALLLFIAVPWGAAAFSQLPRVQGAEFFEAYPPGGPSNNTPPFRVFIAARRVSVALLTTEHALAASVLDPTAKPFVSDHLKHVFDAPPTSFLCEVPKTALSTLGADLAARAVPACAKIGQAQLNSGVVDMAVAECRGVPAPTLCTVRKFARLLQLEESTMECDIKRHDMHGVRLFFALFSEPNPRVYHKAWLAGSDGEAGEPVTYGDEWPRAGQEGEGHAAGGEASNSQGTSRQRFRGPSLAEIQPGGVFDAGGRPAYALLMINVPGLPEGRPALTIGDWVHLRNGTNPLQEVVAVVASTERSTAFLLPANSFWTAELKEALACSPQGGAVHCKEFDPFTSVRFAFDRRPLMHMRGALIATASMAHSARLLPSLDGSDATDPGMQPVLADVTSLAETLPCMSRSGERLNAEQRLAVAAVVLGAGRPSPYAVWGPPGTGKTVTLVACALELRRRYPGCRLLCCAPQNYSADLLCSALAGAGVGGGEMIRLNDPRRPPYTVSRLAEWTEKFSSNADGALLLNKPALFYD